MNDPKENPKTPAASASVSCSAICGQQRTGNAVGANVAGIRKLRGNCTREKGHVGWHYDEKLNVLWPIPSKSPPACKESTVKGTLKAFKTIVNHFTPPGYTIRKSPNDKLTHGATP